MKNKIPQFLSPFLWSYNLKTLDLKEHKERIILGLLNLGDLKAIRWLYAHYKKDDIAAVVARSYAGDWNKKSLNFWSFILGIPLKTIQLRSRHVHQHSRF